MITIELINDYVFGEPPPNLIWRGKTSDYIKLITDLYLLGIENGKYICLNTFDYIDSKELDISLYSSSNGNILNKIDSSKVLINLDAYLWREIMELFLSISFYPSHNYIDFDEHKVFEDANFIISSEVK